MKIIGVIPARIGSTRFPRKPLALIQGRPMIHWVIEGARQSQRLSEVIVATDSEEIVQACRRINCEAVMTNSDLPSGTDRLFAATQKKSFDVVVNIQGDEPLIEGLVIDSLLKFYASSDRLTWPEMATLAHPFNNEGEYQSPNMVKVLINQKSEAIYFSRFPIPLSRHGVNEMGLPAYRHLGLYAYTKDFLKRFCEAPVALIEKAEGLEQLRALDLGAKIKVEIVHEAAIGVDTPEDLLKVEQILAKRKGS